MRLAFETLKSETLDSKFFIKNKIFDDRVHTEKIYGCKESNQNKETQKKGSEIRFFKYWSD